MPGLLAAAWMAMAACVRGASPAPKTDGVLDVTAFGADATGLRDSTAAIQDTFTAAAAVARNSSGAQMERGAPLVRFPSGRYAVSDVINISRFFDSSAPRWPGDAVALRIEGQGMAALVQAGGSDRGLLFCDQAWRVVVTGLRLSGGRDQLALGNNNTGGGATVRVLDCEFEHASGVAVRHLGPSCTEPVCPFPPFVGSFSTQLVIRDCVFDFCDQAVVRYATRYPPAQD